MKQQELLIVIFFLICRQVSFCPDLGGCYIVVEINSFNFFFFVLGIVYEKINYNIIIQILIYTYIYILIQHNLYV